MIGGNTVVEPQTWCDIHGFSFRLFFWLVCAYQLA
jgi:hypothetical protein